MTPRLTWGFSLSATALPLLRRLLETGTLDRLATPPNGEHWQSGELSTLLNSEWGRSQAFVAVGSCGAITRLIAPLLSSKQADPAVVVLDEQGRYAIPILGGHGAGGEALARTIAGRLQGEAVLTGSGASQERLAFDAFGKAWGWRRGSGDWDGLMKAAHQGQPLALDHRQGNERWQQLRGLAGVRQDPSSAHKLVVGSQNAAACSWHPPSLWLGMGCERQTSLSLLQRCLESTLRDQNLALEAIAGIATADRKADEPALLALAEQHGWPLRCFRAEQLSSVKVPNPSAVVAAELGTGSVAEAASLLAAGPQATLLVEKRIEHAAPGEQGAATLAISQAASQWAPQRGTLHLIGSGPGRLDLLTPDARAALAESCIWVGYGLYLDLLEPLRRADQLRSDGQLTQERERCREALELACQGLTVALVSSGDSGIYGMAGLALEQWMALDESERPAFQVHPGISALQVAAARAGAPLMHDFCTISLSDRLTPWEVIERRLKAAAHGDFVVALYNPRSQGRDWQLERAQQLLLQKRPESTPVVLARQLGREQEQVSLHTLAELPIAEVDMLTLVLVGNSTSRVCGGRMVTPRGYPGAELQ